MIERLFEITPGQDYIPIYPSISLLPALPYVILSGIALGVFVGIIHRLADQFPNGK